VVLCVHCAVNLLIWTSRDSDGVRTRIVLGLEERTMDKTCRNCEWADWIHENNEHAKEACATCSGCSNWQVRYTYSMPRPITEANFTELRKGV
jgi:hypothetical protein